MTQQFMTCSRFRANVTRSYIRRLMRNKFRLQGKHVTNVNFKYLWPGALNGSTGGAFVPWTEQLQVAFSSSLGQQCLRNGIINDNTWLSTNPIVTSTSLSQPSWFQQHQFQQQISKPIINVVIIAGQSNAVGARPTDTITNWPVAERTYQSGSLAAWSLNTGTFPDESDGWTMTEPYRKGDDDTQLGTPAISFAARYGTRLVNPSVGPGYIHFGYGGTELAQWHPSTGLIGTDLLSYVDELFEMSPCTIRLVGFVWYQGENDALTASTTYATYQANLTSYISTWRSRFQKYLHPDLTELPMYITRIYSPLNPVNYGRLAEIRTAQENICNTVSNCTLINTDDLTLTVDGIHYTSTAYQTLGNRWADAIGVVR